MIQGKAFSSVRPPKSYLTYQHNKHYCYKLLTQSLFNVISQLATKVLRDEKYTTHDVIKTEVKASSSSSEEECDDLFIGVMLPAMKIFEERLDQDEGNSF